MQNHVLFLLAKWKYKLKSYVISFATDIPSLEVMGRIKVPPPFDVIKSINTNANLLQFAIHSETRIRLVNLTNILSSDAWYFSWNSQMLFFFFFSAKNRWRGIQYFKYT